MKKFKRLSALVFALIMTFSCTFLPASAQDDISTENSDDLILAVLQSANDYETQEFNGFTIHSATLPSKLADLLMLKLHVGETAGIMSDYDYTDYDDNYIHETGTSYYGDISYFNFTLFPQRGQHLFLRVTNVDSDDDGIMDIQTTFSILDINGNPISLSYPKPDVDPGEAQFILLSAGSDYTMSGSVTTSVIPRYCIEVDWDYRASQY